MKHQTESNLSLLQICSRHLSSFSIALPYGTDLPYTLTSAVSTIRTGEIKRHNMARRRLFYDSPVQKEFSIRPFIVQRSNLSQRSEDIENLKSSNVSFKSVKPADLFVTSKKRLYLRNVAVERHPTLTLSTSINKRRQVSRRSKTCSRNPRQACKMQPTTQMEVHQEQSMKGRCQKKYDISLKEFHSNALSTYGLECRSFAFSAVTQSKQALNRHHFYMR